MPLVINKGIVLVLALFFGYNILTFPFWFKDDSFLDIKFTIARHSDSTYWGTTNIDGEECPTIISFDTSSKPKVIKKKDPGFGKIDVTFKREGKKVEIHVTRETDLKQLDDKTVALLYQIHKEIQEYNKSHGIVGKTLICVMGSLEHVRSYL